MKRMLSGHPADAPDPEGKVGKRDIGLIGPTFTSFAMPFGTVYAPNLTPDKETGIGLWTEKMFVDAIRNPVPAHKVRGQLRLEVDGAIQRTVVDDQR